MADYRGQGGEEFDPNIGQPTSYSEVERDVNLEWVAGEEWRLYMRLRGEQGNGRLLGVVSNQEVLGETEARRVQWSAQNPYEDASAAIGFFDEALEFFAAKIMGRR